MATPTQYTKQITSDHHRYKEKENRRPDGPLNLHHIRPTSGSNGSVPKRYQSVFTEGTPLTSFGIRNDDNQLRSHSPPNHHIQPQLHQRPLKPVKEFLTTNPANDQQIDDRWRSNPQANGYIRSQTEATVQNVNAALTKTLNKLRREPLNTVATNDRPTSSRPMTARGISHQNTGTTTTSNFHYQLPGGTKGPLPAELISRRPISSYPSNGVLHNRVSSGTGPIIAQQPVLSTRHEIRSTDNTNMRASVPAKSLDTGLRQLDGFNFNTVTIDEYPDKSRKSKNESNQPSSSRVPNTNHQHRTLPEVSVNPHIQSSVQKNGEHLPHVYERIQNGISHEQIRSQTHENYYVSNLNSGDRYTNHHHHIQVEPTNTFKRAPSPIKQQQIVDVQPDIIVQHQRSTLRPNSAINTHRQSTKDPLNEAYMERDNTGAHLMTIESTQTNNDSSSTLKQYENQHGRNKNSRAPPSSPVTQEVNRVWKKQKNKCSFHPTTVSSSMRKVTKPNRPPGRLKNYGDETDTETTATETQSKDEDMARRHGLPPSDLGSDAWSDLTSEFSDTKLRKHPNIRTSTPNMTRHSSSLSSKEVGQIRKQLTDLQIMYNDLLKLLDIDIESVRSSLKSSTSSQIDHHGRKHRFRKVMPVTSMRHSNFDMREINQRFTRLESSIVTLAESIAKLSQQIQTQRAIKDDVYQLRQEVAELRQQLQQSRHQSSTPISATAVTSSMPTISQQQQPRLISANVQRLATANSTNPLNISTSYMPSTSTVQRTNSIIDPRQARKIEQFFGTEAMLRYFLSLLDYEEYAPVLEKEKIGIYELPYVGERRLQSLGIPYGPCTRIIYEAQQYFISLLSLRSNGIDV